MHTPKTRRRTGLRSSSSVLAVAVAVLVAGCTGHASSPAASASRPATSIPRTVASAFAVPAVRDPLTSDAGSTVSHDNELMALAAHSGRLFAATDQWMYSGPSPAGQILVKADNDAPWAVFEQTQSYRVEAIDSFPVPPDQGLGAGHSLLITQAIAHGQSQIQWLLDDASSFTTSFVLPRGADVRSFGAHESQGVWSVYAGVSPTGILRGAWSPETHTLVFGPTPALSASPPGAPGLKTQKVTGFSECAGALFVSINTKLYRRNDGDLPPGVSRWQLVYEEPPVRALNSGLRGLSCVNHERAPSLLLSTEGNGNVYRLDHLPRGQLRRHAPGLVPILEFSPAPAISRMLSAHGTHVPAIGPGSIGYVIAAYNNFETVTVDGAERQLFGFEWAYRGGVCAPGRKCGPTALGGATYDAAACFGVRADRDSAPSYSLRCIVGPDFAPSGAAGKPIRSGQAFVSIRTITPSPFGDDRIYFGGYDCNFYPADGTAWIGSAASSALHLEEQS